MTSHVEIIHQDAQSQIRAYLDILNDPEGYGPVDKRTMLELLIDYKTKIASLEDITSELKKFNETYMLNGDRKPDEQVSATSAVLYEHILREF